MSEKKNRLNIGRETHFTVDLRPRINGYSTEFFPRMSRKNKKRWKAHNAEIQKYLKKHAEGHDEA